MSDEAVMIVYGAACVVGSAVWAYIERNRLFRRIRRVRKRKIAQLEDNMRARVTGIVRQHQRVVRSGLTSRPCVLYRVEVFRDRSDEMTRPHVIDEIVGVPFVLEDGSGRAVVDATHVQLELQHDTWSTPNAFLRPTPTTDALLKRHGYPTTHDWKSDHWFCESVIRPGDTITVVGLCMRETVEATDAYRSGSGPIAVRMGGSPEQPLWVTRHRRAAD
jgi:hypothetical protein